MAALHDLKREAVKLSPTIEWCRLQYEAGLLADYDVLGVYVLLCLGFRSPRSWCGGRLQPTISGDLDVIPASIAVSSVPGLLDCIGGGDYLRLKMGIRDDRDISIIEIFNVLKLNGIKKNNDHFVNRCLLLWAGRDQRCVLRLMFRIPTPMEVMRQQSLGERVVTVFTTVADLSRHHTAMLHYMDGGMLHARDPFEFTLHDLTHMNKFGLDADTYHEQVGFFKCICNLTKVKHFFTRICGYDEQLWRELEYVFSDMNCYSTHLLQYLLAKMVLATERLITSMTAVTTTTLLPSTGSTTTTTTIATSTLLSITSTTTLDTECNDECKSDKKTSHMVTTGNSPRSSTTLPAKSTKILLMERWRKLLVAMGMKGEPLPTSSSLHPPFLDEEGEEGEDEISEWIDEEVEEGRQGDAYAAAMAMVATTFRYNNQ